MAMTAIATTAMAATILRLNRLTLGALASPVSRSAAFGGV